jgi:hypothetical protein
MFKQTIKVSRRPVSCSGIRGGAGEGEGGGGRRGKGEGGEGGGGMPLTQIAQGKIRAFLEEVKHTTM